MTIFQLLLDRILGLQSPFESYFLQNKFQMGSIRAEVATQLGTSSLGSEEKTTQAMAMGFIERPIETAEILTSTVFQRFIP